MAKPWWQLRPSDNDDDPKPAITFPALTPCRYAFDNAEENALVLCDDGNSDSTGVTLMVDGNGRVTLSVSENAGIFVQVNDRVIENGGNSDLLKAGDRVKLGGSCYVLNRVPSAVASIRFSARQLVSCSICLRACKDARLLRCGHSFCSSCLTRMVELAMAVPQDENPVRLDIGVFGMDEHELMQQTRMIKCGVCRRQFSCWEAIRATTPIALDQSIRAMEKWIDFDETQPQCASCQNDRCLADTRDYEYCQQCNKLLCPACAQDGHRDHTLQDRKAVMKAAHEAGKRLAIMKSKLRQLRKRKADVEAQQLTIEAEFMRFHAAVTNPVSTSIRGCVATLGQIERQMHPFAVIDAALALKFDNGVKESKTKMDNVQNTMSMLEETLGALNRDLLPQEDEGNQ